MKVYLWTNEDGEITGFEVNPDWTDSPAVEIPDEVAAAWTAGSDAWNEGVAALRAWASSMEPGGQATPLDWEEYATGVIDEAALSARIAGCSHDLLRVPMGSPVRNTPENRPRTCAYCEKWVGSDGTAT